MNTPSNLVQLLEAAVGARRCGILLRSLQVPFELMQIEGGSPRDRQTLHRSELAMALAMLLFDDVCRRVPMAEAYVEDARQEGRRLMLDHGALRTLAAPCGELPIGRLAFERFLVPLGYERVGIYPLDRIGMTGHVYASRDAAERLPQYFVSELHPERFGNEFEAAVARVVGTSKDPLGGRAMQLLGSLEGGSGLTLSEALELLPSLAACFDRQHAAPSLRDYELLLGSSAEMAWMATEGNAFNHATDRVDDVAAVAERQRLLGRPIKDELEVSASGRVIQTAFRAATVERLLRDEDGRLVQRRVPGSFHEFITRHAGADGRLDLAFDAGNAQGIFEMTDAKQAS